MALRRIHHYGDPVLLEKGSSFDAVDGEVHLLADDMIETMRAEKGVGLAAQQIGLARNICVVEVPDDFDVDDDGRPLNPGLAMPLVLVNPVILEFSRQTTSMEEGCLSFPGITGSIRRAYSIRLRYTDPEGAEHETEARGFTARVIQHEVDHLNGILFIRHMSPAKRVALKGRLRRLSQETRDALVSG